MHFLYRPHTGASDLSFFLVMPVQRITKYPLLLTKILENTLDSDSVYDILSATTKAMIEVNANINEYKRCKEVGKGNKCDWGTFLKITACPIVLDSLSHLELFVLLTLVYATVCLPSDADSSMKIMGFFCFTVHPATSGL